MGGKLLRALVLPVAGDVVVTTAAGHYTIGRVATDGRVVDIESREDRAKALAFACELVTGRQRVIFYHQAGSSDRLEIHCPKHLRRIAADR